MRCGDNIASARSRRDTCNYIFSKGASYVDIVDAAEVGRQIIIIIIRHVNIVGAAEDRRQT
jgi:hypothetical protein